jgi:predicted dehydrogenase
MNTNLPVRVGVVGCGEHASENLLPSLWMSPYADVVGVCDLDMRVAAAAAKKFPSAKAYDDFHALLDSGSVEAIIAAAPPQVHAEVAKESLMRGIHVFVEKPPTVTTEELSKLALLARQAGLVTGVGHNLRHALASRQLQRLIANKLFGLPICMDMRYFASKPLGDRWGLNSVLRSFLLSHANHALDLMVFQFGPAASVSAIATPGPQGSIAMASQIAFKSGAVGNLLLTTCAPHFSLSLTIVGERRTIAQMDRLSGLVEYGLAEDEKRWGRCWVDRTLDTGYEHAGYQHELDLFLNAVRGQGQMQPSFEDELAVYELMDEIERQVSSSVELRRMVLR